MGGYFLNRLAESDRIYFDPDIQFRMVDVEIIFMSESSNSEAVAASVVVGKACLIKYKRAINNSPQPQKNAFKT